MASKSWILRRNAWMGFLVWWIWALWKGISLCATSAWKLHTLTPPVHHFSSYHTPSLHSSTYMHGNHAYALLAPSSYPFPNFPILISTQTHTAHFLYPPYLMHKPNPFVPYPAYPYPSPSFSPYIHVNTHSFHVHHIPYSVYTPHAHAVIHLS